MIGGWYDRFGPQVPMYIAPSSSWMLQRCPRCDGRGVHGFIEDPENQQECVFCWGVGVVKVSTFSGQPEAVDPPEEPYWHRNAREDAEATATSSSADDAAGGEVGS